jgi:hypothetical protein
VKRLLAIVILNIFLLNVLGYYPVLIGLQKMAGREMTERLDSDMYDLGSTITFKIPLTVPYGTDSEHYEAINGQFEKGGVVYRMVKQRLYHDTLYIVCVKDDLASKINTALADFAQSFAGHDDDGQQKVVPQGLIKDYVDTTVALASFVGGYEIEVAKTSAPRYFFDSYSASIVHPPDRLA